MLLHPLGDFREVFVLLPYVVFLAEVDEVNLYFSTKSKPIVDFSACKDATLAPHSKVVNRECSTKLTDVE